MRCCSSTRRGVFRVCYSTIFEPHAASPLVAYPGTRYVVYDSTSRVFMWRAHSFPSADWIISKILCFPSWRPLTFFVTFYLLKYFSPTLVRHGSGFVLDVNKKSTLFEIPLKKSKEQFLKIVCHHRIYLGFRLHSSVATNTWFLHTGNEWMIAFARRLPSMKNDRLTWCVLICRFLSVYFSGIMRENSIFRVVLVSFCLGKNYLTLLRGAIVNRTKYCW